MVSGLQGKPPSSDVFFYKGETIRIINRRLGDKKQMATDPMIGSVASLAHLEVRLSYACFCFCFVLGVLASDNSFRILRVNVRVQRCT